LSGDIVVRQSEPAPNIINVKQKRKCIVKSNSRLTPEETYFSRKIPAAERRLKRICDLEKRLSEHNLRLLPELDLPPELYDEVFAILDPELTDSDSRTSLYTESNSSKQNFIPAFVRQTVGLRKLQRDTERVHTHMVAGSSPEEHDDYHKKMASLTSAFCNYVREQLPDGSELDQETLKFWYSPEYTRKKKGASKWQQVVRLNTIAPELGAQAGVPPKHNQEKCTNETPPPTNQRQRGYRFGAWYLKPSTWKKLPKGEKLEDPYVIEQNRLAELKKQQNNNNEEMSKLHGAQALKTYILETGRRQPSFIKHLFVT
jgi:hypothetical protein